MLHLKRSSTMIKRTVLTRRFTIIQLLLLMEVIVNKMTAATNEEDYMKARMAILRDEEDRQFIGADVPLTHQEKKVDEYLVRIKRQELKRSHGSSTGFLPGKNFLLAKNDIEQSEVFQFIKKLPKGASLHTHMLAGVNIDYIIQNFTYMDNIYGCYNNLDIFKLKVLQDPKQDANCSWKSLKIYRKEFADENKNFDDFLRDQLMLSDKTVGQTREQVWAKFKTTFTCLYDLVAYRPLFKTYVYQILEELYLDNVLYTELRGTFMPLYDLNGTTYDTKVFFDTFIEAVAEFKSTHPDFLGVKYIHSIYRGVDNTTLKEGLDQLIYFKSLYQDFIAGFDFVGLEEDGKNLVDFHGELLGVAKDLNFYFHAGETNEYGRTDLNLVDAILLNSSRIGHGFALSKHPELLEMARQKDIAIELCPISNQVLKLIEDPRNHPATVLLSKGHPVVVCNDDPSVWNATGLSYDWYTMFMSMTWEQHGLKVLKQLAQNSIQYSAMSGSEKKDALRIWRRQWDEFIKTMVDKLKGNVL